MKCSFMFEFTDDDLRYYNSIVEISSLSVDMLSNKTFALPFSEIG